MSTKYKFADNDKLYFVSFATTSWIDLFIRNEYREEILKNIKYCQSKKDLELYGWCIMTSHIHLNSLMYFHGTNTQLRKNSAAYLR